MSKMAVIYEAERRYFNCFVYKTMSARYIMIKSSSTLMMIQFIDADQPDSVLNDPETSGRNGV
jgi:oligopeptidase B